MNCSKSSLLFGRRTRTDILKDKNIRKDEEGGDIFEDYWTDSEDDKSSHYTKSNLSGNESDNLEKVVFPGSNNTDFNILKKGQKLVVLRESLVDKDHHDTNSDTEGDIAVKEFQSPQDNSRNLRNSNYSKRFESTKLNSSINLGSPRNLPHKQISSKSQFEVLKSPLYKSINETKLYTRRSSRIASCNSKEQNISTSSKLKKSITQFSEIHNDSTEIAHISKCSGENLTVAQMEKHYDEYDMLIMQMMNREENEYTKAPEKDSVNRNLEMLRKQSSVVLSNDKSYSENSIDENNCKDGKTNVVQMIEVDMLKKIDSERSMIVVENEQSVVDKVKEGKLKNCKTASSPLNSEPTVVAEGQNSMNRTCISPSKKQRVLKDRNNVNLNKDKKQCEGLNDTYFTFENSNIQKNKDMEVPQNSVIENSRKNKFKELRSNKNVHQDHKNAGTNKIDKSAARAISFEHDCSTNSNSETIVKAKPSVAAVGQNSINQNCLSSSKRQRALKDKSNMKLNKNQKQFEGLNKTNFTFENSNVPKNKYIEASQNSVIESSRGKKIKKLRTNKNIHQDHKNARTSKIDKSGTRDISLSLDEYEEIESTFIDVYKNICNSKRNKQKVIERFEILDENVQNKTRSKNISVNNKSMQTNKILENNSFEISQEFLSKSKQKDASYDVQKLDSVKGNQKIKRSVNTEISKFNTSNKIGHKTLHMSPETEHSSYMSVSSIEKIKHKKKCNSTINKSIHSTRIRKSKRTRYAPLAHWRNERLLYRFESGEIKILGIDKGTKEDLVIPPYSKIKKLRQRPTKIKKANIYDKVAEKNICINVFKSFSSVQWDTPASASTGNQFCIARTFETKNVSFGYIHINALERKPPQYIPDEDLQITVLKGCIEVLIQENIFKARERDMFIVPRSVAYSLKNVLNSKALLSFVVGRFKFI